MEKLKPILKHKFWIIAGAVLLMTIVGWWIGTSAKAAYIETRWATLSALAVTPGSNTPNQDYIDNIDKVIQVLDKNQEVLDNRLYESQKSLHTWPKNVAKYMEGVQFRDPAKFDALQIYARQHFDEFRAMLASLPRYGWNEETGAEYGIVYIEKDADIPHVPLSVWRNTPPTSDAMWNTQEDIWLTRSIFDAIRDVNQAAGATKISDAPIRSIAKLEFRGGSRVEPGTATGGSMIGYGGGYEPSQDMEDASGGTFGTRGYGGEMGDEMGGGMGGSYQDFALNTTLNVDLDSVLGSETLLATMGDDANAAMPTMPGTQSSMGGAAQKRRYVDDDPALPYRTRGFYIEVLMVHDKLPDLQAALVSMPWPTELLMIQQASSQLDQIKEVVDQTKPGGPPRTGRFNQGMTRGGTFGARPFGGPQRGGFGASRGGAPGQFGGSRFQPGGSRGGAFNPMGGMSRFGGNYNPMAQEDMGEMPSDGGYMGGDSQYQTDASAFGKAMSDPYLAKIGIVGLMTIYRSPQEMAKSETTEAQPVIETELPPTTETPETETPQAEPGTQPVDPENPVPTDPQAEPMPGVPQTEPQSTAPGTEPMPGQFQPTAPGTEPKATEPKPAETSQEPAPTNETPAPAPESPAPMNKTPEEPKPAEGEPNPQNAPPPKTPESLKS